MAVNGYVEADIIASRLNKLFQTKDFDRYLVSEWCAQVEVEYLCDIDIMWEFRAIPLTVGHDKMVLLPCNVYKIMELYDSNKDFLVYNRTETHLTEIRNMFNDEEVKEGDIIYISFKGVPVNKDTGDILIPSGHEPICETYCMKMAFMEEALLGKVDRTIYLDWDRKFSGQIQAVRSSYRNIDKANILRREIINGNMLPKIGRMDIRTEEIY